MISSSRPIEWHEKNLLNRKYYLQRLKEVLDQKQREIWRHEEEISLLETQIKVAKERGKTQFDKERFLVKRKLK